MEKLSYRKQVMIVRMYLNGLSYDEIAAKVGVSKGTVANVIAELKAGRFPEASDVREQIEFLRELAVDLRKSGLTPGRAVVGIAVLSCLQELAVEPADIERFTTVCHTLTQETDIQAFVKAAMDIAALEKRTSLSFYDLEKKAHDLEQAVTNLEPLAQQVREHREQIKKLGEQRQRLTDEVTELEKRLQSLSPKVKEKEKREAHLSSRVQQLEDRAEAADERLVTARKDLQALSGIGLSLEDLSGFTQRLSGIAQRHGIDPGVLCEWLLHELEQLEKGLSLAILFRKEQQELGKTKQSQDKAQEELAALKAATQELRQEQASLHAVIKEERENISKEAQALIMLARNTATRLSQQLGDSVEEAIREVQKLRNHAFEVGSELGRCQATVEVNEWLRQLLALVRCDGDVTGVQVRVVGLALLRGISAWINQRPDDIRALSQLKVRVASTIEELERWKL